MSAKIKLPQDPTNSIVRFGELFFRYEDCLVTAGIYNEGDIESLDLKDLLELRKFIDHKIYLTLIKTV